ncbi:MAG: class II aldolase/adducin family protein [Bryobacteraceae bacterium]
MHAESIAQGHLKTEDEHRREICLAGRWLYERGFITSTDGNLSVRVDRKRILASPAGYCKGMLEPEDLILTDLDGVKLAGKHDPSSELPMHLLIYRRRPDVNAVCHAHPLVATGFAAAGVALDKPLLTEMLLSLGSVPLAPYARPGTPELAGSLVPLVDRHDALLMANHGVVTCGPDLRTAFFRMETVEHFARVTLVTELLGKQVLLSGGDVEKLLAARRASRAAAESGEMPAAIPEAEGRVTLSRRELETLIEEALRKDRARR